MDHDEAVLSQAVERYWLGELAPPKREEFEEHFFVCPLCAEALSLTEALEANVRAAATEKSVQPRFRAWPSWVPAIAAALLVGVVGFDRLVEIPGYRDQISALSAPQVVEPVVLHEAQRGAESSTVIVSKTSPLYYVKFDVADPSGTGYDCVVQTRGGVTVEEMKSVRPPRGGELSLRFDARKTPPGDYVLMLMEPGSRVPSHSYPFSVRAESR
jgi:hypothetical protein